jgi:uroporphyrinogen decarboxylase
MNSRERILAVLNRQPVDRLPVDLWHTPEVGAMLRQHFGAANDLDLYRAMKLDKIVWDFIDYKTGTGEAAGAQSGAGAESGGSRSMWGVPLKNIQAGEAHYAEFGDAPLKDVDSVRQLDDYPWWPQPERFDYDRAVAVAETAAPEFVVIGPWVSFFEIYCQLRGMEQAMMDLALDPDLVDAILDRVEAIQTEMMRRLFARAGHLLTLTFISDDIGGQNGLLMSPASWHRHLEPRMKRWCQLIHDQGLKVFYHSDGGMEPLIGPLIDCGIDVLNPIQHVCPGMDRAALKKKYGDRVVFHGGVENQHALPRGTVAEVRAETRRCLATLGGGKEGYICCSCHNTQPGTPLENILAMIETAQGQ